jgi:hypothetical protein
MNENPIIPHTFVCVCVRFIIDSSNRRVICFKAFCIVCLHVFKVVTKLDRDNTIAYFGRILSLTFNL